MRLDLCLKYSGIIKRRTVCKYYCDRDLVLVNDKVGKPSTDVKDGDVVTLTYGMKTIVFSVSLKKDGNKIYVGYTLISETKREKSDA